MCGIVGFLDPFRGSGSDELERTVRVMSDTLTHRGPDSSGTWVDEQVGVAFGHRRLAIIDLSEQGHQPMVSADGRIVLSFNGEIYNFDELRDDLEQSGIRFRGKSDTEVLLEGIARWGLKRMLERSHGMFALAIWDRRERVLSLARDRMGEKPLYYGWSGNNLLFGSELKALRAHTRFRASIDRNALTLYLRYGYIPAPFSAYQGIQKLPAGTYVEFAGGQPNQATQPCPFWQLSRAVEGGYLEELSPIETVDQLEALLSASVRSQMVADVPLGAFLSGGIDSSTIVALMQAQSIRPIQTFSIGFHERGFDEAVYAKEVAQHLGTDHTELYVRPQEALDVVPRLPTMYDEPFGDSSQVPTHLVAALARQSVTVVLSGDGGDELFGGYRRYDRLAKTWKTVHRVPRPMRGLASSALTAVPARFWAAGLRAMGRLFPQRMADSLPSPRAAQTLAEILRSDTPYTSYHMLISHWRRPHEVVIGGEEPLVVVTDEDSWPSTDDVISWAMLVDALQYLPDDILVKVDRASMADSLEVRVPMLDKDVVEFAWSIPPAIKRTDQGAKWPLRQVLHRHVPKHLVDRPKMGFGVPIHEWLRGPLRDWAEQLLTPSRLEEQELLDPEEIRRVWDQHLAGKRDHEYLLWDVLMLQAWLDEVQP